MLSTAQPCGFPTTTGARDAHAIYLDAASRITEKDSRFVRHYTLGIALYILILMELLTCCTPAFANTLYIGVPTEARVTFDGCDTLVEMRAIFEAAKVSRKEATRLRDATTRR
jgi:hypothetical protein